MKNSKLYYNKIAVNYSNQSESRLNYLDAVDSLILNELSNKECELFRYWSWRWKKIN